jgi:molecular chaperone IbpA
MTNFKYQDPFKNFEKMFIGFEELSKIQEELVKNINSYPFYNIKKVEDNKYAIEMAVAGFGKSNIDITIVDNKLVVKGLTHDNSTDDDYLFKGVSTKPFTRMFALSDQIEVQSSELVNGMLKIYLEKIIPEDKKPRKIEVQ